MLGTQNRFIIYKKGLEGEVDIQPPKLLGDKGVKSPAYLALNPQGKMPLLVLPDGQALPESQVSSRLAGCASSAKQRRHCPAEERQQGEVVTAWGGAWPPVAQPLAALSSFPPCSRAHSAGQRAHFPCTFPPLRPR